MTRVERKCQELLRWPRCWGGPGPSKLSGLPLGPRGGRPRSGGSQHPAPIAHHPPGPCHPPASAPHHHGPPLGPLGAPSPPGRLLPALRFSAFGMSGLGTPSRVRLPVYIFARMCVCVHIHTHMDVPVLPGRKDRHKAASDMWSGCYRAYTFPFPPEKSNPSWKHMYVCSYFFKQSLIFD